MKKGKGIPKESVSAPDLSDTREAAKSKTAASGERKVAQCDYFWVLVWSVSLQGSQDIGTDGDTQTMSVEHGLPIALFCVNTFTGMKGECAHTEVCHKALFTNH